jgi:hypothetical protein
LVAVCAVLACGVFLLFIFFIRRFRHHSYLQKSFETTQP